MTEPQEQHQGASASLVTVQHVFGDDSTDYSAIIISDGTDTVRLDLDDLVQIVEALFGDKGLLTSDPEDEVNIMDLPVASPDPQAVGSDNGHPDRRLVVKRSGRPTVE